jgi:hypothetical protein
MPTTALTAEKPPRIRRRAVRLPHTPAGWLTAADLIQRDIFGSHASVDRAIVRPEDANPLPKPARDRVTNARYWREQDIAAWVERERERMAGRLVLPEAALAATRP